MASSQSYHSYQAFFDNDLLFAISFFSNSSFMLIRASTGFLGFKTGRGVCFLGLVAVVGVRFWALKRI